MSNTLPLFLNFLIGDLLWYKMAWKNKVEEFPHPPISHKNKEMKVIIQLYCNVAILG